jgi:hypothetical protein
MREKLAVKRDVSRAVPDYGSLMAAVNEEIRALAHHLGDHPEWNWPFVCECGDEACQEPVLCSLGAYDEARQRRQLLLARGHAVTQAREARARSHELRVESEAVRAQAEHQLRRSRLLQP